MSPRAHSGCLIRRVGYTRAQYVRPSERAREAIGTLYRAAAEWNWRVDHVQLVEMERAENAVKVPSRSRNNLCDCQIGFIENVR